MNTLDPILANITPEIVQKFKTAIELRKWPDGRLLTSQQLETCLQAVIAYEHQNLPEHERTGYVPPKTTACEPPEQEPTTPIKWQ